MFPMCKYELNFLFFFPSPVECSLNASTYTKSVLRVVELKSVKLVCLPADVKVVLL